MLRSRSVPSAIVTEPPSCIDYGVYHLSYLIVFDRDSAKRTLHERQRRLAPLIHTTLHHAFVLKLRAPKRLPLGAANANDG